MLATLTLAYQGIGKKTLDRLVSSDQNFPKISAPQLHLKECLFQESLGAWVLPYTKLSKNSATKKLLSYPIKTCFGPLNQAFF
jgi:hypothetical protein